MQLTGQESTTLSFIQGGDPSGTRLASYDLRAYKVVMSGETYTPIFVLGPEQMSITTRGAGVSRGGS